jgi:hypothetical protein
MLIREIPMKPHVLTTALLAGLGATPVVPALAQDAVQSPFQSEAAGPSVSASDVIGARIYVTETALDADRYNGVQEGWNDIGEVNDIILGVDGTVDAVLVDIGGFLGIGERQVAVDMSALKVVQDDATDQDDWFLVLQADRATLDAAPEWVIPGADRVEGDGTGVGNATDTTAGTEGGVDGTGDAAGDASGDVATDGTMTDGTAPDATAETGTAAEQDATATQDNMAGQDTAVAEREGYTMLDRNALTSEMLTGANVHDRDDNSIAEVSDLVLTTDGQVTDVLVDVGGFLGIGERTVAIPLDRVTVGRDEGGMVRIWVDMARADLEALPEVAR